MPLGQGNWEEADGILYFFAKCMRRDCSIGVFCYDGLGGGPWDLPAEFSYLIAPTFARLNEAARIEPSPKSKQENAELRSRIAAFDRFKNGDQTSLPSA
jgi:hypothetical protein